MPQLDFLGDLKRTHKCGELRPSDIGRQVILMGWVNRRRDLGQLIFIDLRDRTGITQVVFDREASAPLHDKASELRNEFVIAVVGTVKERESKNPKMPTGDIEVVATELRLLNESKVPPFLPTENVTASEELKLKYRYIDLRRAEMQFNIELRHKVTLAIREYLNSQGFLEIETPILTRSTPEGARDYLVPSRVHPGEFYALPQSPQIFKQILMISGFDRYFQIARCFRDEDLRADRQPDFTQVDLEMTFPRQETVFAVVEGFLQAAFKVAGYDILAPFPQMTYDQAIRLYGIDKPDLRLPAMTDISSAFTVEQKQTLQLDAELPIVAICIPKVGELSRKEREELRPLFGKASGPKLIDDIKRLEKSFPEAVAKIREWSESAPEDLLVVVGSGVAPDRSEPHMRAARTLVYTTAGSFRLALAQKFAERHQCFKPGDFRFLWVTDFPMFEWNNEAGKWDAAHHPFTSPHEEDMGKLGGGMAAVRDFYSDLSTVRALAYDIVLNGTELGSGSIRIHRQDVQAQIFAALGMDEEEQKRRFGFFLEALEYGTPPHGGIALGLDRIAMILAGAPSLREVIPFPKTAQARDLMMDAPSKVDTPQEDELELMAAWPHLERLHWDLAGYCDRLFKLTDSHMIGRNFDATSVLNRAAVLLFGKALNDARSSVRLAKSGYGPQAVILARSVIEGALNLRYIVTGGEERAALFLRTSGQRSHQGQEQWPSLSERLAALDPNEAEHIEKALNASPESEGYSIASQAPYISDTEAGWKVETGRSSHDVDLPLVYVFDFFSELADITSRIVFGTPIAGLGELREQYARTQLPNVPI